MRYKVYLKNTLGKGFRTQHHYLIYPYLLFLFLSCKKNDQLPNHLPEPFIGYDVVLQNPSGQTFASIHIVDSFPLSGLAIGVTSSSFGFGHSLTSTSGSSGNIEYIPQNTSTFPNRNLNTGITFNGNIALKTYTMNGTTTQIINGHTYYITNGGITVKDPSIASTFNKDLIPFSNIKPDDYVTLTIDNIQPFNWSNQGVIKNDSLIDGKFEMRLSTDSLPLFGWDKNHVIVKNGVFKKLHISR